jgi:surface antigen
VAGPVAASRQPRYSGSSGVRLWRGLPAAAGLLLIALSCGGCAMSYQLGSLFGTEEKAEYTASIGGARSGAPAGETASAIPPEHDLAYARAAAAEVLNRGGKDTSASWSNPHTGARGTVTPISTAYNESGLVCRDFLASYVRDGSEAWLQGEACRMQKGKWEVRSLKPWKRS